jgi:hypothetical protein
VRHRTRDAWVPTWQSDAADEVTITSRLLRNDGTPWGTSPAETVFTVAAMLIGAALENAQAVHLLLSESPTSTLVIETITRAALEAACQAWNLMEPGIGARARVARLYVLRRCSAERLEDTAQRMNIMLTPGYEPRPADIDQLYRDQLGLVEDLNPKGNWIGCEGQKPFSYTERVAEFIRDVGQSQIRDRMLSTPVRRMRSYGASCTVMRRGKPLTERNFWCRGHRVTSSAQLSLSALMPLHGLPCAPSYYSVAAPRSLNSEASDKKCVKP